MYYRGPLHKISSKSVHNFLSYVVHRQTDRQTNQRYQKHNLLCQGGNKLDFKKVHSDEIIGLHFAQTGNKFGFDFVVLSDNW